MYIFFNVTIIFEIKMFNYSCRYNIFLRSTQIVQRQITLEICGDYYYYCS